MIAYPCFGPDARLARINSSGSDAGPLRGLRAIVRITIYCNSIVGNSDEGSLESNSRVRCDHVRACGRARPRRRPFGRLSEPARGARLPRDADPRNRRAGLAHRHARAGASHVGSLPARLSTGGSASDSSCAAREDATPLGRIRRRPPAQGVMAHAGCGWSLSHPGRARVGHADGRQAAPDRSRFLGIAALPSWATFTEGPLYV